MAVLRNGMRVVYQDRAKNRFGAVNLNDRGTALGPFTVGKLRPKQVFSVLWDDGWAADDVTPTGFCPDHGYMVVPLREGVPDVANRTEDADAT